MFEIKLNWDVLSSYTKSNWKQDMTLVLGRQADIQPRDIAMHSIHLKYQK